MRTLEALTTRRSCRAYTREMPEHQLIDLVVEAGEYAPTGRGMQAPLIVVITEKKLRDEIAEMNREILGSDFDPFYGAPCIIVVLADKQRPTYLCDGSLVLGNMMNAAHALGMASCWIHRAKEEFESERGRELLKEWGIEGDYEGIGHLALGYAATEPVTAKPRKLDYVRYIE